MTFGVALVRRPGPKLADGLVVRPRPEPIDLGVALDQHARYRAALTAAGWQVVEAPPADELPDATFVEDTAVLLGDRVLLTRPGHPARVGEVASVASTLAELGVRTASLPAGCRLDGGDVLTVGHTVYIGLSERSDEAAVRAVAALLGPDGWQVRAVPVTGCLHLKSAVTALPDGTLFGVPEWVDADSLGAPMLRAPEPAGAAVLRLGPNRVGVSASARRTVDLLAARGLDPVALDVGEFEALDAGPTCLSVLLPRSLWAVGGTADG